MSCANDVAPMWGRSERGEADGAAARGASDVSACETGAFVGSVLTAQSRDCVKTAQP